MRAVIASFILITGLAACDKSGSAVEEARKEAETKLKEKSTELPKTLRPPVAGSAKLPCSQVIDLEKFGTALEEKEPMTITDVTKNEAEAAASCDLVRGGKKLTEAEQKALIKKEGRLGMLAGDTVCNVTLLCSTIETADKYRTRCLERAARDAKRPQAVFAGEKGDDTMGSFACVQIVPTGAFDAQVFRFFDPDTKCIIQVRGGPSNQDNDLIRKCAVTARDTIGPDQIKVTAK